MRAPGASESTSRKDDPATRPLESIACRELGTRRNTVCPLTVTPMEGAPGTKTAHEMTYMPLANTYQRRGTAFMQGSLWQGLRD